MKRTVIKIDEALCNGCGLCVKGCHEGALQLINGKAVMVSELYCDGLGACIGECPEGAIELEEREAEPYSEEAVMERISPKGETVILAHLKHLKEHGEKGLLMQGVDYLRRNNIQVDLSQIHGQQHTGGAHSGCPGSMARTLRPAVQATSVAGIVQSGFSAPTQGGVTAPQASELRQWPVQLHLLNPQAGYFQGADVLLAADCTSFTAGNFHDRFLKGKILAIACPKLDSNTESYIEKLRVMIDDSKIDTLTVLIMEVPCCGGLLQMAKIAREKASRHIPIKNIVLSVQGEIKSEVWI
ncbi:4Fe-4S dicluster domain-containing protein [uncultured Bacteroides sp.]|uniref:ATP-binding protein n=1 Tax=uncultured Bacteroides sp. TaxID=162156 RepID=UPI002AAA9E59|nr:4Fe-4S dicluster domain-containing protein [uncultured Bacteroides sp.]